MKKMIKMNRNNKTKPGMTLLSGILAGYCACVSADAKAELPCNNPNLTNTYKSIKAEHRDYAIKTTSAKADNGTYNVTMHSLSPFWGCEVHMYSPDFDMKRNTVTVLKDGKLYYEADYIGFSIARFAITTNGILTIDEVTNKGKVWKRTINLEDKILYQLQEKM